MSKPVSARRLPLIKGKEACYEMLLEAMQEGCATLLDFKQEIRFDKSGDIPLKVFLDLLLEMENLGMIERRYQDALERDNPSTYMWFPVTVDSRGIRHTAPYFHRQSKLTREERMDLYYGVNESVATEFISQKEITRLGRIQHGAVEGDAQVEFKYLYVNTPAAARKSYKIERDG